MSEGATKGVRDYRPEDYAALERLHAAQGLDYALPAMNTPEGEKRALFFVAKVVEKDGVVCGALVLRLCAEAMLLLDAGDGPREKMMAMQELQAEALSEAKALGLDEVHAAVPAIGFDRRLRELGWEKDRPGWVLWSRTTTL